MDWTRDCPSCNSPNHPQAEKCYRCGALIRRAPAATSDLDSTPLSSAPRQSGTGSVEAEFCPSCGKLRSSGLRFCGSCGFEFDGGQGQVGAIRQQASGTANTTFAWEAAPVATAPAQRLTEWEYHTFVLKWEHKKTGWISASGPNGYTDVAARLSYWQDYQKVIMPELLKWLDQGWEPIGDIGPSCIELRTFKSATTGRGPIGLAVETTLTFGINLVARDWFYELAAFTVNLRRRKR